MALRWAYYNDNSPEICDWTRYLIRKRLITDGDVDCRPVEEVEPNDVTPYARAHFFCGINGWERALQLAQWPEDWRVWTGSCPCQDFSVAGKREGIGASRDLWPVWFRLIRECRPVTVFGEQVANAIRHGWLDRIYRDMEEEGYAVGEAVLGAHSAGAPHIRQRLYYVLSRISDFGCDSGSRRSTGSRLRRASDSGMADRQRAGLEGRKGLGTDVATKLPAIERGSEISEADFWDSRDWVSCLDGFWRRVPVEPSLFPLAPRLPGRMGVLRGAGNSIVPQVASLFVRAFIEERQARILRGNLASSIRFVSK